MEEENVVEEKSLLEQTKDIVAAQKEQNDRTEELVTRMEEAKVQTMIGGQSTAGQEPEPKKVLTDIEYAEALEKGEVNPFKEDKVEGY